MQPILAVLASAVAAAIAVRFILIMARAKSPSIVRRSLGVGLIAAGIVFMFFRLFIPAFLLLLAGTGLAIRRERGPGHSSTGRESKVRSVHLEMTLDHDTGDMDGTVLTGEHQGRILSDFDLAGLLELSAEFGDDAESVKLLETYLDRAHSNWRDSATENATSGQDSAPVSGRISRDAAYRVLGLKPGASESDIREAYHRLIKRVHPDHGGTAELAAQINEARDRLLEGR